MKLGHCTNCGMEYHQTIMKNGVPLTLRGKEIFKVADDKVIDGNYHEVGLLLDNGSKTSISLCTSCSAVSFKVMPEAFIRLARFMVEQAKLSGVQSQAKFWSEVKYLEIINE